MASEFSSLGMWSGFRFHYVHLRMISFWIVIFPENLLFGTSTGGVKQVKVEKNDFGCRCISKLWAFSAFSQYQDSDRTKKQLFLLQSFTSRKLLIETLMDKVNRLVIQNHEFEYRKASKMKAISAAFAKGLLTRGTNWIFSLWVPFFGKKFSVERSMRKTKLIDLKFYEFENRRLYSLLTFMVFSACQDSNTKQNIGFFFHLKSHPHVWGCWLRLWSKHWIADLWKKVSFNIKQNQNLWVYNLRRFYETVWKKMLNFTNFLVTKTFAAGQSKLHSSVQRNLLVFFKK